MFTWFIAHVHCSLLEPEYGPAYKVAQDLNTFYNIKSLVRCKIIHEDIFRTRAIRKKKRILRQGFWVSFWNIILEMEYVYISIRACFFGGTDYTEQSVANVDPETLRKVARKTLRKADACFLKRW